MSLETHSIFVALDCLLDTRLASIGIYDEDVAAKLLKEGIYHKRKHNRFDKLLEGVDQEKIDNIYNNRDEEVLKQSVVTPIAFMIRDIAERYRKVEGAWPVSKRVEVIVDSHPYTLDKDTLEAIRESLLTVMTVASVKFCNLPPETITPEYLSQYDDVIWYELDNWMNIHHKALGSKVMQEVNFYCPEILVDPDRDMTDIPPDMPRNELRIFLAELIQLEAIPLELFSVIK